MSQRMSRLIAEPILHFRQDYGENPSCSYKFYQVFSGTFHFFFVGGGGGNFPKISEISSVSQVRTTAF